MASHIRIDTGRLAAMGTQLARLHDGLSNSTDISSHYEGALGSGELADALHDFAGDWSKKKATLLGQLQELSQAATGAAKTWSGADGELAKALLKADSSSGTSGGKG